MLDTVSKRWNSDYLIPPLNKSRAHHGSCGVGKTAFVFAGLSYDRLGWRYCNTIEQLDFDISLGSTDRCKPREWKVFTIKELSPRQNALLVAISSTKLLIGGGNFHGKLESDGVIFDIGTRKVCKVKDGLFKSACFQNQSLISETGSILVVPDDAESHG